MANARIETLGPAERVVNTVTTFTDHLYHGRPGVVTTDPTTPIGVKWQAATWRLQDDGSRKVFLKTLQGKKTVETAFGTLDADGKTVRDGGVVKGEYRTPGVFPEVAAYLYGQVASVFKMDNEFVARWASWAAPKDHRDTKVILAAFLLVQNRAGAPILGADGNVEFHDDDYRDVAEALCLLRVAKSDNMNPKMLLRVGELLKLPQVADINRNLGFGLSARNPTMGRYPKVVSKWLRFREENVALLDGLVKAGMGNIVKDLARLVGYKPTSESFYEKLRWKQKQASDGRRQIAIGKEVKAAETWEGLSETEICQRIVDTKPNYKRIVGLLPASVGLTRAVVMAAVQAGCLSDADLLIYSPTWEDLGMMQVAPFKARWQAAADKATNQRALNVSRNVKSKDLQESLEAAADKATAKALAAVTKDLRTYVIIDKSGSMESTLERMQANLTKFLGGFPLERTHISVFNTVGTEIKIKSPTAAGVRQAFMGHTASGGTHHAAGVKVLAKYKPLPGEDALMIFAGDEGDHGVMPLVDEIRKSGINPVALAILPATPGGNGVHYKIVRDAAGVLGVPCLTLDDAMFNDPYSVTRTLTNLIASTPVGQTVGVVAPKRITLVEEILNTPLLEPPLWAKAA